MDRIEPIRPSLPPIDTTRVRKVFGESERQAAQREASEREARQRRRQESEEQGEREWLTDEEDSQQDEDQDGPPRIDVRA